MTVNEEIEQIVFSEQCWSDHTRLCIYEDFIKKMNLESAFLTYNKEIAAETESVSREGFGVVIFDFTLDS